MARPNTNPEPEVGVGNITQGWQLYSADGRKKETPCHDSTSSHLLTLNAKQPMTNLLFEPYHLMKHIAKTAIIYLTLTKKTLHV
jgi:hypothetical protein